jgi:hypothetical protein
MAHILTKPASTVPPSPSEIRLRCEKYGRALEVLGLDFPGYLIIESAMHNLALGKKITLRIYDGVSGTDTGAVAPSGTGAVAPSGTGAVAPSGTGAVAPSSTGAAAPSGTGAVAPSGTGAVAPSGTGAAAPSSTGAVAPSGTGAAAFPLWTKLRYIANVECVEYTWTPTKVTMDVETGRRIRWRKIVGKYEPNRNLVVSSTVETKYFDNLVNDKVKVNENFTSPTGFAKRVFLGTNQSKREIQGPNNVKVLFTDGTTKILASISVENGGTSS